MPIEHSFTDKQSRKLKRIFLTYTILFLVLISIPFVLAQVNKDEKDKNKENNTQQETNETKYLCIINDLEDKYDIFLENYAKDKKYTIVTGNNPDCTISIARNITNINEYYKLAETIYVLAGRIDTSLNALTQTQLNLYLTEQNVNGYNTIWDESSDSFIRSKFVNIGVGQKVYEKGERHVKTLTTNTTLSVIPFEEVDNRYKVITIEGNNPLDRDLNTNRYPLVDKYWIKGDRKEREDLTKELNETLKPFTYDSSKIQKLLLTGSSATGSGIQQELRKGSNSYISLELRNLIKNADLAQLNNEASISNPCIQSEKTSKHCTTKDDIDQIKQLGFDVVGVNGNHIMDISYDTYVDTLKWYKSNKIPYYAGGQNSEDAWKPGIVERDGIKYGFVGFNFLYPFSYYARKDTAGSANVDMDIMKRVIKEADSKANIVIVDMGWGYEYDTRLIDYQIEYATKALEYGADIVIGTHPKIFQKQYHSLNKSILYGTGTFLPHSYSNTDSAVYEVTTYDGKYISMKTIPLTYTNKTLTLAIDDQLGKIYDKVYRDLEIK